jgi:hypothetical protein
VLWYCIYLSGYVMFPVNTDELILNVCNDKLGLDINLHDIGRSHIIGKVTDVKSQVIVRFISYSLEYCSWPILDSSSLIVLSKASTSVECSFKANVWSLSVVWRVVIIAACFESVCACSVIVFVACWQFLLMYLHGHQHVFWFYRISISDLTDIIPQKAPSTRKTITNKL